MLAFHSDWLLVGPGLLGDASTSVLSASTAGALSYQKKGNLQSKTKQINAKQCEAMQSEAERNDAT